jgi:ribosomal protein S2
MNYIFKQLDGSNITQLKKLLKVFGEAFNEAETYREKEIHLVIPLR